MGLDVYLEKFPDYEGSKRRGVELCSGCERHRKIQPLAENVVAAWRAVGNVGEGDLVDAMANLGTRLAELAQALEDPLNESEIRS